MLERKKCVERKGQVAMEAIALLLYIGVHEYCLGIYEKKRALERLPWSLGVFRISILLFLGAYGLGSGAGLGGAPGKLTGLFVLISTLYIADLDLRYQLIPNVFLGLLGLVRLPSLLALLREEEGWASLMGYLATGLVTFLVLLLVFVCLKGALGAGDVKWLALLGLYLGTSQLLHLVFVSSLVLLLVSLVLLASRRIHRKSLLPFAPFVALVLFSDRVWPFL